MKKSLANFLVCIDSDGCVFNSMEWKHRECFLPAFIQHFGLSEISRRATDIWVGINLYSQTRGCNRLIALQNALVQLLELPERNSRHPEWSTTATALGQWLKNEPHPSTDRLEQSLKRQPDQALKKCLRWSQDVNARIARHPGSAPFEAARHALENMSRHARLLVVSQTPVHTLENEWQRYGLKKFTEKINGQEAGSKASQIQALLQQNAAPENILVVGDAPGDNAAAAQNHCLFFPIIPGAEEDSWAELHTHAFPKFLDGSYHGRYQTEKIAQFQHSLNNHELAEK